MARELVKGTDFEVDEKERNLALTETGIAKTERIMKLPNLFTDFANSSLAHKIVQALKAHHLFQRDVHYVVKDGEIVIVDEFTGRLMFGRRYSDGLHQAIEAKERVRIGRENQTLATITLQNYFRMYKKLAGMTGTAKTEAEEFKEIYGLNVIVVPTHKPMIRKDNPDAVYKTAEEKYTAAADEVAEYHAKGQPILVGTASIEHSERVSQAAARAQDSAQRAEREGPRQGSRDSRAGRTLRRGHSRDEHGGPRNGHRPRRKRGVPRARRAC